MNRSSLVAFSLFSFILITSIAAAQLGEVAGQPTFNTSIGGTNTIQITIINQANYQLPVKVILPVLTTKDANTITPTVTAAPMVGNVPPDGQLHINVTVYVPGGTNKPGDSWTGVLQIVTIPTTSSSAGGATILEGVAKVVTINAGQPTFNISDYLIPIAVVVIVAVAAAGVYMMRKKGKGPSRKSSAAAKRSTRGRKGSRSRKAPKRGKRSTRPRARSRTAASRRRRR